MLLSKSHALGFDAIGVAPVTSLPEEGKHLEEWLEKGFHAGMKYMARNVEKRVNPALLVEEAKSVIVTLTNYYTPVWQPEGMPVISRYAYGKDYHLVVKERLQKLTAGLEGRCFVDSAPVLEHEWGRRAGLGWIGKNTLLINRSLGSFCFIGVMITTAGFDRYSHPFEDDFCGKCNRCLMACPTGALSEHAVDARKCVSYNTIENKEDYPEALKKRSGNRIFGCDICQEACPWNRWARPHTVDAFLPQKEALELTAEEWQKMDEQTFQRLFNNTPLERTGLFRIRRNLST